MEIVGFDWDRGNWPKCREHGVSREEIEEVLLGRPVVEDAPFPSEKRWKAVGQTNAGRYVYIIFTLRGLYEKRLRPISARYMHRKEIDTYEKTT